jgi:hypothetical protein
MEGRETRHAEAVVKASQSGGEFWEMGSESFEGCVVDKS